MAKWLVGNPVALVRELSPEWREPVGGHRVGFALHCGDAAGVDAMYAKRASAG